MPLYGPHDEHPPCPRRPPQEVHSAIGSAAGNGSGARIGAGAGAGGGSLAPSLIPSLTLSFFTASLAASLASTFAPFLASCTWMMTGWLSATSTWSAGIKIRTDFSTTTGVSAKAGKFCGAMGEVGTASIAGRTGAEGSVCTWPSWGRIAGMRSCAHARGWFHAPAKREAATKVFRKNLPVDQPFTFGSL